MVVGRPVTPELKCLARKLADWTKGQEQFSIFLFGSRVRGDHRLDSDVDVIVRWEMVDESLFHWWKSQNEENFQSIHSKIPGNLDILEYNDPISAKVIRAAEAPVFKDRNVICVWMPPKRNH